VLPAQRKSCTGSWARFTLNDRSFVSPIAGLFRWEKIPRFHPSARALERLARVGLEHDALARAEPTDIDQRVIALGQLSQKVMLVSFRFEVDGMLRPAQRFEITLDILQVGSLRNYVADHEGRVDNFPETELRRDIKRRAEQTCRRDLAICEQRQAVQQQAAEMQFDLIAR